MLRVMSGLVDTSLFALNIATALSLGLAVDYGLLLVSRYREELDAAGGATEEAHRSTVQTAGRTVLFSGFTVALALAALVLMPQRFLYSVGAAGAAVGLLSARHRDARRALDAGAAGPAHQRAVDPPRAGGVGRLQPLVSRSRKAVDAPPGRRRARQHAAAARAGLARCWATTLTGPSAEAVPPSQPSYAVNEYVEEHYSRGVIESRSRSRCAGGASPASSRCCTARIAAHRRHRGRHAVRARVAATLAFASFAPAGPALDERVQDAVRAIRARTAPGGGARCSCPATPRASSTRRRASSTTCRSSDRSSPAARCCCSSRSPARSCCRSRRCS